MTNGNPKDKKSGKIPNAKESQNCFLLFLPTEIHHRSQCDMMSMISLKE